MTDRTATTLPDRFAAALPRAAALAPLMTFGAIAWMQLLHARMGAHEAGAPGALAHVVRDGALAFPAVLGALVLALAFARSAGRHLREDEGRLRVALPLCGVALATGLVMGLGTIVHGALFDAEAGHHGGATGGVVGHVLRDTALAMPGTLVLAAVGLGLLAAAPRLGRRVEGVRIAISGTPARAALALALMAMVSIGAQRATESATAQGTPGAPCPTGAPTKSFDVRAIDVKIPLNRFGDNDPAGKMYVLEQELAAVREQERTQEVSIGLRDDAIQPLVIRANVGDCVEVNFTNAATGGEYGMHIDGLSFHAASSGDAVGENASSAVPQNGSRTYRFYVPDDARAEGTHYIRPGPGHRNAVGHGLFGALAVQPKGSEYLHPDTHAPLRSGWEAVIAAPGKKAFREYVKLYHEIGDESEPVFARDGTRLPVVDPITTSYRPSSRGINYRSEPFMHRLEQATDKKASSYNSYTFGDPATPMQRAYVHDPSKIRIVHAGSEMFHVYHLHGGGIRWPQNPKADPNWDFADTRLNKSPAAGATNRLDSQSFGPGESFTLEIEGGAGGVQGAVGDLLEHCHIAEHYVSGMWAFWRVYNTLQPELKALPGRDAPPAAVDSAGLVGKTMPDGTALTAANVGDWVEQLLPPRGVPQSDSDASVWNWALDTTGEGAPVYLGEPEETTAWPNLPRTEPGHPSALPGDTFVKLAGETVDRPKILFNPADGRPAYPLLRTNVGQRPPHAPDGHSGTPFLGAAQRSAKRAAVDPWAGREDGLCPTGAPTRRFDMTSITIDVPVTKNRSDPTGKLFVLSEDKEAVRSGKKPVEPLALRANIGDCVAGTLTTEFTRAAPGDPMPQSNVHIHHVQFDPQGSDGASAGMVYDQAVLPYREVDPKLTAPAASGATTLELATVAKFQKGVWIGVGLGEPNPEVRRIVDITGTTVTLDRALDRDHAAGQWAGTEFVQFRWFPDVDLDNVFWHDHVDGIHGWGKGAVGQLIVEPKGSTYHDPTTGEEVKSGTFVDIRTTNPLAPGLVESSFRELALWTIDDNPVTDSTMNLRAEPWADRLTKDPDGSLLFSSWRHGDPNTPLPKAYKGDPFVMRTINVSGNGMDSLRLSGHRFFTEARQRDAAGKPNSTPKDTLQYGVSERFTAILEGGAGGPRAQAGDYLYMNGIGRRFRQGAWGLFRVLGTLDPKLQPLPGRTVPAGPAAPVATGGRPPEVDDAGNPCPVDVPQRTFDVAAVDLPVGAARPGVQSAFVPTAQAGDVEAGRIAAEPLVLHAAAGDCVTVKLSNRRGTGANGPRASLHVGEVGQTALSSGVNAGFNGEQTVAPGDTRTYRYYADTRYIGSAPIGDFGDVDTGARGLYGMLVVAPYRATFKDPKTGKPRDTGAQVDVELPGGGGYRDVALSLFDNDAEIGANTMPYPTATEFPALVNYQTVGDGTPRGDGDSAFASAANGGDPPTPLIKAHLGDRVKVHVLGAPGSEQPHAFSLGGLSWAADSRNPGSNLLSTVAVTPWMTHDLEVEGGAGGRGGAVGDFWYGDLRRVFTQAGMWGLVRVLPEDSCEVRPLDGRPCGTAPAAGRVAPPADADPPAPTWTKPGADPLPPEPERRDEQPAAASSPRGATAPAATPRAAAGGAQPTGLRSLVVSRALRLKAVKRRGIELRVTAPADARALLVELTPVSGAKAAAGARKPVATLVRNISRGGTIRMRWHLRPAALKGLKPGTYVLRVRAGRTLQAIAPERVELRVTLRR